MLEGIRLPQNVCPPCSCPIQASYQVASVRPTQYRPFQAVQCYNGSARGRTFQRSQARNQVTETTGLPVIPVDPHELAPKREIYLLRSDGLSCTREFVKAGGGLTFSRTYSQQHYLAWKEPPKCVMVLRKPGPELHGPFLEVLDYFRTKQMTVLVERSCYATLPQNAEYSHVFAFEPEVAPQLYGAVDFVVNLGGDGLILYVASLFGAAIPPLISFKLGSLGFLTCHSHEHILQHLEEILRGSQELSVPSEDAPNNGAMTVRGIPVTLRMRLSCRVCRLDGRQGPPIDVLNEVVLSRGANPYLCNIEVFERENLVTQVQADGIMVATPTGSTAYSVAAGGSLVHPHCPAILITPICPHSLSFRPVILPDYVILRLRVRPDARSGVLVSFDGRRSVELAPGESITARMSRHPVPTINHIDQTTDWFASIQRCFNWNDRTGQKKLDD